jgi:hypothetical protein
MVSAISPFEYVTILVSIILGLGITKILSSLAELLYDFKKVRFFWVHTIWVILILYIHVQEWFILYELKGYPAWKLPVFLFILIYPITLFLAASMLFPVIDKNEEVDLKTFFSNNYKPLYFLFLICIVLSLIFNLWLLDVSFKQQVFLIVLLLITSFLLLQKKLTVRIHQAFAVLLLFFAIASIVVEQNTWTIK